MGLYNLDRLRIEVLMHQIKLISSTAALSNILFWTGILAHNFFVIQSLDKTQDMCILLGPAKLYYLLSLRQSKAPGK
jgi:hypothetical protein